MLSHSATSNSLQPIDCSPPGSTLHGIFQAKILEWVAIASSKTLTNKYMFSSPCLPFSTEMQVSLIWNDNSRAIIKKKKQDSQTLTLCFPTRFLFPPSTCLWLKEEQVSSESTETITLKEALPLWRHQGGKTAAFPEN